MATATIPGTSVASTGNAQVDQALAAQAQAVTDSIVLATKTNTAVTEINAVASAARKVLPS